MNTYRTFAPGKVNLCLYVGERNVTGLHELASLVVPLSLADEMILEVDQGSTLVQDEVVCTGVSGPNLASQALAIYRERTGWDGPPVRLTINKRIPVAAGMGGGSSDAATALRLIDCAARQSLSAAVHEIAPLLGSDVSALLHWQPSLITGVGEHVEPFEISEELAFVVVPADGELSTANVYSEFDRGSKPRSLSELNELARAIRSAFIKGEFPDRLLHNDLSRAAVNLFPALTNTLTQLSNAGANPALVAGSGPTAFGLFRGQGAHRAASAAVKQLLAAGLRAIVTVPATHQSAQITCSHSS